MFLLSEYYYIEIALQLNLANYELVANVLPIPAQYAIDSLNDEILGPIVYVLPFGMTINTFNNIDTERAHFLFCGTSLGQ